MIIIISFFYTFILKHSLQDLQLNFMHEVNTNTHVVKRKNIINLRYAWH